MENFLVRHTIPMPDSDEPIRRHYSLPAKSYDEALAVAHKFDDGDKPFTIVEVIGHVVDGWPVFDLGHRDMESLGATRPSR